MTETDALDKETAEAISNELLRLADSKLLLGYRYSQWMFSAPSLEACNAASSISQDEFGHARALYTAHLSMTDDVEEDELMHEREPEEYWNAPALDQTSETWTELVVDAFLIDSAIGELVSALEYDAIGRMQDKIEQEESFHDRYGHVWLTRLAGDDPEATQAAVDETFESVYAWFGPENDVRQLQADSPRTDEPLVEADLRPPASEVREQWLESVESVIEDVGLSFPDTPSPDREAWDGDRWRLDDGGPDQPSIEQLRGDESAAFR